MSCCQKAKINRIRDGKRLSWQKKRANTHTLLKNALEMIKKRRSPGVLRLYAGKNVFYEQIKNENYH